MYLKDLIISKVLLFVYLFTYLFVFYPLSYKF